MRVVIEALTEESSMGGGKPFENYSCLFKNDDGTSARGTISRRGQPLLAAGTECDLPVIAVRENGKYDRMVPAFGVMVPLSRPKA